MITYNQLKAGRTLQEIAIALGFMSPGSNKQRKYKAVCRISNWRRTGIPPRVIARHGDALAKLIGLPEAAK